jgi:hypothetical protein
MGTHAFTWQPRRARHMEKQIDPPLALFYQPAPLAECHRWLYSGQPFGSSGNPAPQYPAI